MFAKVLRRPLPFPDVPEGQRPSVSYNPKEGPGAKCRSLLKVPGRDCDLCEGPWKASALSQIFLKDSNIHPKKDPVQSDDTCKGPGRALSS